RTKTATHIHGTVSKNLQRAQRNQRRSCSRGARAVLVKKKDELGLKGPLKGHFKQELKRAVVAVINNAVTGGLTQKRACEIFGIASRKFRRWANPKPLRPRTAWNKVFEHERDAIEAAAWTPELIGKPVSHIFVHGHESGKFFASLSTVYRVLKAKNMVEPRKHWQRRAPYISAHSLLDEGFSLLCYDGTQFKTDSGIIVWAIPVMILPQRYLLHIGHSLNGISSGDLTQSVKEAYALLPEHLTAKLVAHSDRGSAMKSSSTKQIIKELLGAPVHFGRPHTPDDQSWIEAFIKTLKYHRDAPRSFKLIDDILQWFNRIPDIYNNDPHSSLSYVTPLQALSGQREVILNQRKQNLATARMLRYTTWKATHSLLLPAASEVVMQPA
ncbi:MAG: transposase, partial [Candidatus Omnitrophica bacterium]|nr:transposase [Candidatus Omnitrophota bacterium]